MSEKSNTASWRGQPWRVNHRSAFVARGMDGTVVITDWDWIFNRMHIFLPGENGRRHPFGMIVFALDSEYGRMAHAIRPNDDMSPTEERRKDPLEWLNTDEVDYHIDI